MNDNFDSLYFAATVAYNNQHIIESCKESCKIPSPITEIISDQKINEVTKSFAQKSKIEGILSFL